MKQRKHLNHKGKFAVLIFLTSILFFLVGWGTINKEKNNDQHATAVSSKPAKQLAISFKPKKAFASSELNHSVLVHRKQVKEAAARKAERKKEKTQLQKAKTRLAKGHRNKVIYLTFDDGPSSSASQLLDTLNQYDAKATFFMLGPNIQDHPSVVKRMVKEGFGVGLHSMSHNAHKIYSSKAAPLNEMTKDQQILQNVTGVKSKLIRLPYGSVPYLTLDMRSLLDKKGFKIWDWNVDSKDWELKDRRYVQKAINGIQSMERAGEAPIVLMHDKPQTVHYLPKLLSYIKKQGYQTKILTNDMPAFTFQCENRCYSIS